MLTTYLRSQTLRVRAGIQTQVSPPAEVPCLCGTLLQEVGYLCYRLGDEDWKVGVSHSQGPWTESSEGVLMLFPRVPLPKER